GHAHPRRAPGVELPEGLAALKQITLRQIIHRLREVEDALHPQAELPDRRRVAAFGAEANLVDRPSVVFVERAIVYSEEGWPRKQGVTARCGPRRRPAQAQDLRPGVIGVLDQFLEYRETTFVPVLQVGLNEADDSRGAGVDVAHLRALPGVQGTS